MKDIILGFYLLLSFPSILYFWKVFIYLEKTKQINLLNMDRKVKKHGKKHRL